MANPVIPPDISLSFTTQQMTCPIDGLVGIQVYADYSLWCPVHNGYLRSDQVPELLKVDGE